VADEKSPFAIRHSQCTKLAAKKKIRGGACLSAFAKPRKTFGGESPTDAMSDYAVPYGHGRAPSGVRTTVGVPPRLFAKGTFVVFGAQLQARLPGTRRTGLACLLSGRYPPLPVPESSAHRAPQS
jgi:hypothetical protein